MIWMRSPLRRHPLYWMIFGCSNFEWFLISRRSETSLISLIASFLSYWSIALYTHPNAPSPSLCQCPSPSTSNLIWKQGKKVCKTTAVSCHQCSSLRFLLAKANWLENNSYSGHLLSAVDRSEYFFVHQSVYSSVDSTRVCFNRNP